VWDQNWERLRSVQAEAVGPVLDGRDVVIAAATASGKTEAAWLPIVSALATQQDTGRDHLGGGGRAIRDGGGVRALYLGPLKALINDQFLRLESLGGYVDVPVHRWHGDIAGSKKHQVLRNPDGILLITPESLEALFVREGPRLATLFAGLRCVVVDELHSFIGTERGAQLQSLMHRLDLAVRRRVPRIGLSATLADKTLAASFLRPARPDDVVVLDNPGGDTAELKLQLRGYIKPDPAHALPQPANARGGSDGDLDDLDDVVASRDALDIAAHLFKTLRGRDNLVFANSRAFVEAYADILTRMSADHRVPNEFFPHHGNLSKAYREEVEDRLRSSDLPTTAICTSTLEMGIDIGSTDAVAQLGAPGSVAALRQRLGRSGRRDQPAVMRMYVSETEVTERTPPADQVRAQLFQTVAMTNLMLHERWYDPPNTSDLHLSTLVQQIFSVIAQHGGASPADLFTTLCARGPFGAIDKATFLALLRDLGAAELLTQAGDGLLLHGPVGDRIVNHYSFYAAFTTAEEYRLVARGRTLGSIPVDYPVLAGSLMIFAGRRWVVVDVDTTSRVIELSRSSGGRPPAFSGNGGEVADLVRQRMRQLYEADDVDVYLNEPSQRLLDEGRDAYRLLRLGHRMLLPWGTDTVIFPWRGDRVMNTVAVALASRGLNVGIDGVALTVSKASPDDIRAAVVDILSVPIPDPVELAEPVPNKEQDKYDQYLSDTLLSKAYAARSLDVPGAWETLQAIAEDPHADPADAGEPRHVERSEPVSVDGGGEVVDGEPLLGQTGFAVIDLETTGFAPHLQDRVVEVAMVLVDPEGTVTGSWSTLVNPGRDTGPAHVHGIHNGDVEGAPSFTELADWLADLIRGRVVVAHNAEFDLAFLASEFERADVDLLAVGSLCTQQLTGRLGLLDPESSRDLHSCCSAVGITLNGAHTATGDAEATAALLGHCLRFAIAHGARSLGELGFEPAPDTPSSQAPGGRPGPGHEQGGCSPVSTQPRLMPRTALRPPSP
jgi:ATP-dependent Lhr-like helicase